MVRKYRRGKSYRGPNPITLRDQFVARSRPLCIFIFSHGGQVICTKADKRAMARVSKRYNATCTIVLCVGTDKIVFFFFFVRESFLHPSINKRCIIVLGKMETLLKVGRKLNTSAYSRRLHVYEESNVYISWLYILYFPRIENIFFFFYDTFSSSTRLFLDRCRKIFSFEVTRRGFGATSFYFRRWLFMKGLFVQALILNYSFSAEGFRQRLIPACGCGRGLDYFWFLFLFNTLRPYFKLGSVLIFARVMIVFTKWRLTVCTYRSIRKRKTS